MPRLEDWSWKLGGADDRLQGYVYDDARFEDGELVITSRVEYITGLTGERSEAKTRNTTYILGEQAR